MRHPAHPDYHKTWFNSAYHGPALPFIAAAAMGAQALGAIAQGKQQAASDKYNAAVAENNATIANQNATFAGQEGAANAAIEQAKTRATVGGIKAAQAANGIDVNTGSAVDVRSSASELGELNAINIRSNATRQAYGFETQASNDKAQAQLDRSQAKYDSEAGYVKAGTGLLSSAATAGTSGTFDKWLNAGSMNAPSSMGPWQE